MPETSALKALARRVKNKALEKADWILSHESEVDKELFAQTFLTVLKNAVPRSQEISGGDDGPIGIKIISYGAGDNLNKQANDDTPQLPTDAVASGDIESTSEV